MRSIGFNVKVYYLVEFLNYSHRSWFEPRQYIPNPIFEKAWPGHRSFCAVLFWYNVLTFWFLALRIKFLSIISRISYNFASNNYVCICLCYNVHYIRVSNYWNYMYWSKWKIDWRPVKLYIKKYLIWSIRWIHICLVLYVFCI